MSDHVEEGRLYLTVSPEIQKELLKSGMSLDTILQKIHAQGIEKAPDPATLEGARSDFMTICLGSAAVIAAMTPLITNAIATLVHRPVIVRNRELAPALDGSGNAIKDARGQPVMHWRDIATVDRGSTPPNVTSSVKATAQGVEIALGDTHA
jgi:hypothetical protein